MKKLNEERLMKVLLAPIVSEKATMIAEKREQVAFKVIQDATKPEIKAAVELLFKVKVEGVQVSNLKGKAKRFGKYSASKLLNSCLLWRKPLSQFIAPSKGSKLMWIGSLAEPSCQ